MKKLAAGLLLGAVLFGTITQNVCAKEAVNFDEWDVYWDGAGKTGDGRTGEIPYVLKRQRLEVSSDHEPGR